ncbi:MAG: phosphate ABC transporter permease PstA [Gemmatales bacterium]|nr:phosphate ABC transporter permease PstA [Gemmatales bacterium]MDW7994549.1 phosphate ABC transporter permease PstA [Gemmatales bacterium]
MSQLPARTGNPLRDPPWTFRELWPSALLWSAQAPLIVLLLIALDWLVGWSGDFAWTNLFLRGLILTVFLGIGIFLGYLLYWSRTVRAHVFVGITVAVTSISLFVLAWFILSLVRDGWRWFENTQRALQEHNQALLRRMQDFQQECQQELENFDLEAKQARQSLEQEIQEQLKIASSPEERAQLEEQAHALRQRLEQRLQAARQRLLENQEQTRREIEIQVRVEWRDDISAVSALRQFLLGTAKDEPARTGILPAIVGSFYMAIIVLCVAVPIGVGAAVYLEEFGRRTVLAHIVEINLANLAGVPSVVYGILGAFIFVELIFQPLVTHEGQFRVRWLQEWTEWLFGNQVKVAHRNTLGGGLTLALLSLPVIIITAQEAIRAVPVSVRHAALALGATHWQVISHHVLPYAFPNILTGVILAISRVLGEAAPLVLFGAFLYLDFTPHLFSRFTVLPMQIYNWASRPQPAWHYCAAMTSLVLLALLLILNAAAIVLRQRGQRRWRW